MGHPSCLKRFKTRLVGNIYHKLYGGNLRLRSASSQFDAVSSVIPDNDTARLVCQLSGPIGTDPKDTPVMDLVIVLLQIVVVLLTFVSLVVSFGPSYDTGYTGQPCELYTSLFGVFHGVMSGDISPYVHLVGGHQSKLDTVSWKEEHQMGYFNNLLTIMTGGDLYYYIECGTTVVYSYYVFSRVQMCLRCILFILFFIRL